MGQGDSGIGHFLTTRRAKVTPSEAGLPESGLRRVPGLRREEVAALANVSTDYYVQIERGRARGVSEDVLRAIAAALRLDPVETAHLFDLAGLTLPPFVAPAEPELSPLVSAMIAAMGEIPVVVQNSRLDIVAANPLGYALYSPVVERADGAPNLARYVFGDDDARAYYGEDRDLMARHVVALLRLALARPGDVRAVEALVHELSSVEEFRTLWGRHDVEIHRAGIKRVRHPLVGDLCLRYEGLDVPSLPGATLYGYQAESAAADGALQRLRSHGYADSSR
ncbi:helix-turn-helix transcriptional regulator [Tsukamurella sp. NPDC003166]|uniref:helix-turn-helix domain-containing protein n=1 Tax=Tsukamurella sp. NPDC003166 TaxID=3154444 RepID=UPI0033A1422F